MENLGKEFFIKKLKDAQTLERIIKVVVDNNIKDGAYIDNIKVV